MFLFSTLLSPILGGSAVHAVEFEVLDKFSADGYSEFKGTVAVPSGGFTVGGSTFVVKGGNVGIGTTAPLSKLDVNDGGIALKGAISNDAPRPVIGSGYAGLINGEIWAHSSVYPSNIAGLLRLSGGGIENNDASAKSWIDISGYSNIADLSNTIVFGTNGTERMRILNGNVGIGTTAPGGGGGNVDIRYPTSVVNRGGSTSAQLFVSDSATSQALNAGGRIDFGGWQSAGAFPYTWGGIAGRAQNATGYGGYLSLYTQNTASTLVEAMRIDQAGNVGIGTTAPGAPLEIFASQPTSSLYSSNTSTTTGTLYTELRFHSYGGVSTPSSNYDDAQIQIVRGNHSYSGHSATHDADMLFLTNGNNNGAVPTEKMRIQSDGNVGIGTTAPNHLLTLSGDIYPS